MAKEPCACASCAKLREITVREAVDIFRHAQGEIQGIEALLGYLRRQAVPRG